jgi:hypothetical protein
MARPRIHVLPQNLYTSKGYYRYKKSDGTEVYLGADKDAAIKFALHANLHRANGYARRPNGVRTRLKELLDHEHIVSLCQPYSPCVGVYFLIYEEKIVYVGQATNCHSRISSHAAGREMKLFDSFYIVECPAHKLDELEALYIRKFLPPLNKLMSGERYVS